MTVTSNALVMTNFYSSTFLLLESKPLLQNLFNLTSVEKPDNPTWFIHMSLPMSNGAFKPHNLSWPSGLS